MQINVIEYQGTIEKNGQFRDTGNIEYKTQNEADNQDKKHNTENYLKKEATGWTRMPLKGK